MTGLESIVDVDHVDTFLESISTLVSESKLHVEGNGLRVSAVDPANVAGVHAMLGEKAFESYEIDEKALVGVDLDRLEEALGFADSGATVGISTDVDGEKTTEGGLRELAGFLEVRTGGITHDMAMIDTDSIRQEPDPPSLDLPASITLEGRDLKTGVRAADTVSDHAIFAVDEDEQLFTIAGKGDTDSVDVELREEDLIDATYGEARSLFSLDYLTDVVKPIPADAEVQIELGEDFPTVIKWGYAEGFGTVMYFVAPRIEKD